ncbi:MAG: TetR/AcrR family transcriptional regulator [Candidatus Kapaibacterium sp.]
MVKNEIQAQRMRSFFIDSAKNFIKSEGLASISARNVAENAGYSYATIYNHFKDLKELVFICAAEFLEELKNEAEKAAADKKGAEAVKEMLWASLKYFMQYTGVYELIFIERMSANGFNRGLHERITGFFPELIDSYWAKLTEEKNWPSEESIEKKLVLLNWFYGIMLMYLNRISPREFADFKLNFDKQINRLIS